MTETLKVRDLYPHIEAIYDLAAENTRLRKALEEIRALPDPEALPHEAARFLKCAQEIAREAM